MYISVLFFATPWRCPLNCELGLRSSWFYRRVPKAQEPLSRGMQGKCAGARTDLGQPGCRPLSFTQVAVADVYKPSWNAATQHKLLVPGVELICSLRTQLFYSP